MSFSKIGGLGIREEKKAGWFACIRELLYLAQQRKNNGFAYGIK
jgi:hypothetical protein